jgi:hypothetical protein
MKFIIVAIMLSITLSAGASPGRKFPIPDFENDFHELAEASMDLVGKYGAGQETFTNLTLPFAPLDLSKSEKMAPGELLDHQNFTFGFLSSVFQADQDKRTADFFCKNLCWLERENKTKKNLNEVLALVEKFKKASDVQIVSQWNIGDQFRVNDFFVLKEGPTKAIPSRDLKIISSGRWAKLNESDMKAFKKLSEATTALVKDLKKLKIPAMVKAKNNGVIVFYDGFADNAWGVLVLSNSEKKKFKAPSLEWSEIQDGVWFFHKGGKQYEII